MTGKRKNRGFSLVEMLVVVSIIVLMLSLAMPNAAVLIRSQKLNSAENMIRSALAQARAHAAVNQRYAGVRFEFDRTGWQKGRQYLVLIENYLLATNEFVAVANVKPLIMPDGLGAVSGEVNSTNGNTYLENPTYLINDGNINPYCMNGATTFSIVFSPSGQVVMKNVLVRPRNVDDKIINHQERVDIQDNSVYREFKALLYCDGFVKGSTWETIPPFQHDIYYMPWCVAEYSTSGLYIYETDKMLAVTDPTLRWTQYVSKLTPMLINSYTGQIIEEEW